MTKAINLRKRLTPAPLRTVRFSGGFWGSRIETNRMVTLPIQYQQCKQTGRLDAFRLTWKNGEPNRPHQFWDSDIAKWIEAAAYSLTTHPDPQLEKLVDEAVDLIASAQQPDGYLNIYYTVVKPGQRWTNLRDDHELYCAGHLMEAAVAYYSATGKRKLLDVMCRYADHIDSVFGPQEGKKRGYCGHPEVELALFRLYRATGQKQYLDLAKYFIDERGHQPHYFDLEAEARGEKGKKHLPYEYYQAHMPVRQQKAIEGHAVRALYLLSGMIDVAAETADAELLAACKRLWRSAVERRMYITGGVGSQRQLERFTFDYDLPNETAYAETCASIALVFASHRLLQVDPDSRYADVMELALYNGVISGVSLRGDRFFYANPLAVHQEALSPDCPGHIAGRRQEWFGCACCPPNLARLLSSLGQYVYSTDQSAIYVHLYASGEAELGVAGQIVKITQKTDYPWRERIELTVTPRQPAEFVVALRIPGWCEKPAIRISGKPLQAGRGYVRIRRRWVEGDRIELILPMPIRRVYTTPRCRNNIGKVAIQRGPFVYCIEEADNGPDLHALVLPRNARLVAEHKPRLLGGVTVISGPARKLVPAGERLYTTSPPRTRPARLVAIPYCVWANRKPGHMQVWIPTV